MATLSGLGAPEQMALVGSTQPFDKAALDRLYPNGQDDYLVKFKAALDHAIAGGFIWRTTGKRSLRLQVSATRT